MQQVSPEDLETFIVLALLVLDSQGGEGVYVSAGAEPLLLLRSGGEAQAVVRPAQPLGVERETVYEPTPVHLAVGDAALLLTDGITEARRPRETGAPPGAVWRPVTARGAAALESRLARS